MASDWLRCILVILLNIAKVFAESFAKVFAESEYVCRGNTFLLLNESEVRNVSYGPRFFPLIYGPNEKRAGHKSTEKNEVSKIFIISPR